MVPVIGGKGERYMKSKIKYSDEPLGKVKIVDDFPIQFINLVVATTNFAGKVVTQPP